MAHKFVDKLNYTSEMKRPVVIMAHKSVNRETPQSGFSINEISTVEIRQKYITEI